MTDDHDSYQVQWSAEDGEHVATCTAFPSLSWLAADPVEALRGIQELVASVVADLRIGGEPTP